MTRRAGPLLLWIAATTAAIAVATAAIGQVGRQVALDAPLDARLARATGAPASAAPSAPGPSSPGPDGGSTPAPEVRTYEVVGGRAAVAVTGGRVEVRWATPREGFRASVEGRPDGSELRVEFRSESHRSRIDVAVEGGRVVEEIDEDDRD